ncbi:MAG: penicillin acylase family protein [Fimbriimonadaceae bacterium]|nr:penicillin acylase family protein [Fimbriimonadaceae bacterium]
MVGWIALAVVASAERFNDGYGVPRLTADSVSAVMRALGEAHAMDRLWQLEVSRRVATGTMSEIVGASALEADKQTRQMGYTQSELTEMIAALPPDTQSILTNYAAGVNDGIEARRNAQTLPPGYRDFNLQPNPWTVEDTAAIAVLMISRFGTGGAGELRDLAMLEYAKISPARSQPFDLLDELAWRSDPEGIPTLSPDEDASNGAIPKLIPPVSRAQTEAHLASLPKTLLLELLPAIRVADYTDQKLIAAQFSVIPKAGSYAVVVSPKRSKNGRALLMSAPQMGHFVPNTVYEACLDVPGYQVQGITIPGVPGVVIGHTPNIAWGLTSGVADCEDIYAAFGTADGGYLVAGQPRPMQRRTETIKVAGAEPVQFVVERTEFGPVLLHSTSGDRPILSVRKSFWKQELEAMSSFFGVPSLKSAKEVLDRAGRFPASFNVFAADSHGNIGYRYAGRFPIRRAGLDPRLPIPADGTEAWPRFATPAEMPHTLNPNSGLLVNWNNKPIRDWPNMDTPVWGPIFRNELLVNALGDGPFTSGDLVAAAREIAQGEDTTSGMFRNEFLGAIASDPEFTTARWSLERFDGTWKNGDYDSAFYLACVNALRRNAYLNKTGNFTSDQFFSTVIQPSTIMRALRGRSALGVEISREVLRKSVRDAMSATIRPTERAGLYADQPFGPVAYLNRGTYIQVASLGGGTVRASTVLGPGNAESGDHLSDQVPLTAGWRLKPSWINRIH